MKKMSAEDSQTLVSQSTTDQAAEEPGLIPSASLQFDDWDEAGKVDIRLLRCYCETDLAGVLRPRTWQDVHHGRPGYRAGWLLTSFMPKVWMGLCVLTPRQYAAAECLLAAEGLEAPFQPIEECPDWTEAACLEGKRLSLARGLHSYMLHLTESEARPLMAMNEALQRFKAKCEESWNDAAPEESNPATDGPQAAPESAEAVPINSAIPTACLATRQEILDAFGNRGFKQGWFRNVTERRWLHDARKRKGQGQRGQIVEPLFCPYEVMQGLVHSTRPKNGTQRMSKGKGWQVLEHKFPDAYMRFSINDPRELTG